MSLSVRHAFLIFALPLTQLFAEPAPLPPALAALRVKAEGGNSIAQYNLGLAYAQGREIPADPVEAFVWLNLAAESGTAGKAYDDLLRDITPGQLAEAKRRLAQRKNSGIASPIVLAPLDEPASPDRLAELTVKNQQLTAELAAAQAKFTAAQDAAGRSIVAAKAEANSVADALNAKFTALETQLTAAKSDLSAAQAKLAAAGDQNSKVASLESENARASEHASALQKQVDELTADRAILKQKLSESGRAAAPKPDDSAPQIAALQAQVAALSAAKSSTEQKLAAAEARLSAVPAPAPAATAAVSRANNDELAAANAKLETALHSFTLAQNENAELKTAAENARAESATLRQQLADAQTKAAAPEPVVASTDDPAELKRELTNTETKLSVALRSYVVVSAENDKLKAEAASHTDASAQAIAAAEARAASAAAQQSAQLNEVRDQLRQVQAQSAVYAEENFQLRTRLATGGGGTTAPTRGADRLTVSPVPASALVTPPPAAPTPTPAAARTHTIVAGDTLQGLAKKYYGNSARWSDILAANNDVLAGKPNLVIGRTLRIP